jgi:hypothetical protein
MEGYTPDGRGEGCYVQGTYLPLITPSPGLRMAKASSYPGTSIARDSESGYADGEGDGNGGDLMAMHACDYCQAVRGSKTSQ